LVGHCGNSGNSTEPHLHFHVQDHPNFFLGMGLPVQFECIEIEHPTKNISEKHEQAYIGAGQRVRQRKPSIWLR
jgi:murein DD-endopeptidase MepM/ murein hydrolase activator NlpD